MVEGPWQAPTNQVLAGPAVAPADGDSTAEAGFRALVASDLPGGGATVVNAVAGVGAGYKVARGLAAVTGTLDVNTGLATVVAAAVSMDDDPAITGNLASVVLGGTAGHITVKAWKPTASGDCTPIAATAVKNIFWIAVGT